MSKTEDLLYTAIDLVCSDFFSSDLACWDERKLIYCDDSEINLMQQDTGSVLMLVRVELVS